jgi:RNA polymerase sigma-70 factor (sigma-E family)
MDERTEQEFREYVAARQAALFRVALLLTGHRQDAEDLLQTALTKLALHWTAASKATSIDAYVRKILYNHQVGHWRRRGQHREYPTPAPPRSGVVEDPAVDTTLRVTLAGALALLTHRQRAVLVLRYYEDLPEGEVARILGCGVGTVRSQTARTLARLRTLCPELDSATMETA